MVGDESTRAGALPPLSGWAAPLNAIPALPSLYADRGGIEFRPGIREKISRKSPRGELAQAMFDSWMRRNGVQAADGKPVKFPKRSGGQPSLWWEMAGVATTYLLGKPGPLADYLLHLLGEAAAVDDGGHVQVYRAVDGRQDPDGTVPATTLAAQLAARLTQSDVPGREGLREVLNGFLESGPCRCWYGSTTAWAVEQSDALVTLLAIRPAAMGLGVHNGRRLPAPAVLAAKVYGGLVERRTAAGAQSLPPWSTLGSGERAARTQEALLYLEAIQDMTGWEEL